MIALPKAKMKLLVAVHGWSGVTLGLFLYVVVLTGALAVFAQEIGAWSVGGQKWEQPLGKWVGVAVNKQVRAAPEAYREDISVFANSEGRLVIFAHTHAINADGDVDDQGVLVELDPESHEVLATREGFGSDVFGQDAAGALDEFIVDLHVNLHLPEPWGLYATGVLGFMMLVAAVSGFLLHRHLIADLFLSPRSSSAVLTARDRHNLLGAWMLPFSLILAFTGAFLSFFFSIALPLLADVAFAGDEIAMFETLFGVHGGAPARSAAMAPLDGIINQSTALAGSPPTFVTIEHWGRSDAKITLFHPPSGSNFSEVRNVYNGVTGVFEGEGTVVGTEPSLGASVLDLMFALHFGTFSGMLSRVIWLAAGLAMAYLAWTGLKLWLRRRADDPAWRPVGLVAVAVVWGTPLALAGAAVGFFLTLPFEATRIWTPVGFIVVAAACLAAPLRWRDDAALASALKAALGAALIALPVLRILITGLGWSAPSGVGRVFMIDLALAALGVGLLRSGLQALRTAKASQDDKPTRLVAPAE